MTSRRVGRRPAARAPLGVCVALAFGAAGGGAAWAAQGLTIVPTAALTETVTSNVTGRPDGPSDAITQLSAGLRANLLSARTQAALDYTLSAVVYARDDDRNTSQNALSATLQSEWYERQGFLAANASIRQSAVSAFGAQPGVSALPGANVTELRSLQVAPRWEGFLGPHLRIDLNAAAGLTDAKDTDNGDGATSSAEVRLSPARPGVLGWSLVGSRSRSDFDAGRGSGSTRAYAALSYLLTDLDLQLSGTAGRERSDVASALERSVWTRGLGLNWTPSPRAQLAANWDKRAFGNTHSVSLSYRTPLTVWSLSGSRSLTESGATFQAGARAALFNLFFFDPRFVSLAADPVQRTALVNAFIDALPQSALADAGFLRSAATLDQTVALSAAMRLQRGSVTVTHSRTRSQRADAAATAPDDLAATPSLRMRTSSVAWSHQLTPQLSGTALVSVQTGAGQAASQSSEQRTYSVQLAGKLGAQTSWSLSLRRVLHDTSLLPYGESVLTANLGYRF